LLTDADTKEETEAQKDVVKLMTIHAAKGLEFPCVFAVGLEENIFPSAMSMYDRDDLEEERRLFYVVVTRAKKKLWITLAKNRYRFGSLVSNEPSRFIEELPPLMVEKTMLSSNSFNSRIDADAPTLWGKPAATTTNTGASKIIAQKKVVGVNAASSHVPSENFTVANPIDIVQGIRVEHQRFGFGTVAVVEGTTADKKAKIIFEKGIGEKMMMLNFAKLSIVQE
jgi:DNA helicase II / ATP-dependent DNA helicase PcrA